MHLIARTPPPAIRSKPKKPKELEKGFTIIEVVLVLAIAGLIFLMVFVALPALQRMQRNTQRKNDLARFVAAVVDYQSKNNGQSPFVQIHGSTDFGIGNSARVRQFIIRYIDSTCSNTGQFLAQWQNSRPDNDICTGDQFRDPLGNIYSFFFSGMTWGYGNNHEAIILQCDAPKCAGQYANGYYSFMDDVRDVIWVTAGVCGATEGSIFQSNNRRDIAMLMVLEGGAITCISSGPNVKRTPPANSPVFRFTREISG